MSQRTVERTLGRLVTDEGFRDRFFRDPEAACLHIGAELTGQELEALKRIPRLALADLCAKIDDRICKLHIAAETMPEEQRR
jgi:putative modified peptide